MSNAQMPRTFTDQQLVSRYRSMQRLSADAPCTIEQVMRHWTLEHELAQQLLASTPDTRWTVFEEAYTRLYGELDWLGADGEKPRDELRFREYELVIGEPPADIYEVGSGAGALLMYLAARGYRCKGTEITRERGAGRAGIEWGNSDGVHLDLFESARSYDVVVSSQVIEHIHPSDLVTHLQSARTILRPGGRYVFDTPHRLHGPMDVSNVFGYEVAAGMHLKEYTFREIRAAAEAAGYSQVEAIFRLPLKVQSKLPFRLRPRPSKLFISYLEVVESVLSRIPTHSIRRRVARAAMVIGFQTIFVQLHA